jgi:hypothetical protein
MHLDLHCSSTMLILLKYLRTQMYLLGGQLDFGLIPLKIELSYYWCHLSSECIKYKINSAVGFGTILGDVNI